MNYIVVDNDLFLKYETDPRKAELLSRESLQVELGIHIDSLNALPPEVSDEELLAWAKQNYPGMNYETQRTFLTNRIAEIQTDLAGAE